MPRRPEDIDDGSPYGGEHVANPDQVYGTRVPAPDVRGMRPGASFRSIDKGETERIGTTGRASVNVERPVELTPIDFDPRVSAPVGVKPVAFDHDPRTQIGSLTVTDTPLFVVMGRLKTAGDDGPGGKVESWIWMRHKKGQIIPDELVNQLAILARFGDREALRHYNWVTQQLNPRVLDAMRRAEQQRRARLGLR